MGLTTAVFGLWPAATHADESFLLHLPNKTSQQAQACTVQAAAHGRRVFGAVTDAGDQAHCVIATQGRFLANGDFEATTAVRNPLSFREWKRADVRAVIAAKDVLHKCAVRFDGTPEKSADCLAFKQWHDREDRPTESQPTRDRD